MQKTAKKQEEFIVNQIKAKIPDDWSYVNYCNGEEEQFFKNNPLDEFPNIIEKWNLMPCQPHKADLFRYYYLYIYGGVFIDGDAMIYDNITNIILNNNFVTAIGVDPSTIWNGFICTFPKNPIIYEALKYAYNIEVSKFMNNYNLLCKNLYNIIHETKYDFKIKLYYEYHNKIGESAKVIGDNGNTIAIHYFKYKIIPLDTENNIKTIIIGPSDACVKLVTLTQIYKNPKFKLNDNPFSDKFEFELFNNILIIKRTDAGYGWAHNHMVEVEEAN
jgi:hypothetical protein